jgi:hypothetical protein
LVSLVERMGVDKDRDIWLDNVRDIGDHVFEEVARSRVERRLKEELQQVLRSSGVLG